MDSDQASPSAGATRAPAPRSSSTLWIGVGLAVLVIAGVALFALGAFKPDPGKRAIEANKKAASAILALPANADVATTLAALNQIVVPFAAGSNALPPEAEEVLRVVAQKINTLPATTKIDVVALAETMPKTEPEFRLILERASAVVAFLEKNGVAPGRLRAIGTSVPVPAGKSAAPYTGPQITFRPGS
jgi:outer membrane protein OmpA-like peptidoglycan-associated protein